MALVRVLVDGYSLLHSCPDIAPGRAPHSAAARDALVQLLTRYQDASGTPVTVIFDGAAARGARPATPSTREVEILYSRADQTADQMIERAAHRLAAYGEVLVVTDDHAERETAGAAGAHTSSCPGFIQTVQNAISDLRRDVTSHNRRERHKFRYD